LDPQNKYVYVLSVLLQSARFHIAEQKKEKCSKLKDINHCANCAFTMSTVEGLSDDKTFSIQETGRIFENVFITEQVIRWRGIGVNILLCFYAQSEQRRGR